MHIFEEGMVGCLVVAEYLCFYLYSGFFMEGSHFVLFIIMESSPDVDIMWSCLYSIGKHYGLAGGNGASYQVMVVRAVFLSHWVSWGQGKDAKMIKDKLEVRNGVETGKHEWKKLT